MPRQKPVVMDGTRGPRAEYIDEVRARADEQPEMPRVLPKVDGTVYLSMYPGYMVQISAPADITDPFTGKKKIGRPVVARFENGRYVNNARDPELRKFIDTEMQSKTRFGKPGSGADYWLAEDAVRMARAADKASAKATLRKLAAENRDEFRQLISELEQGEDTDVKMPAVPNAPGVMA